MPCTVAGLPVSGPNIPETQRKRPTLGLTLSPSAHQALEKLAIRAGTTRSAVVEALVLAAAANRPAEESVFKNAFKRIRRFGRFKLKSRLARRPK